MSDYEDENGDDDQIDYDPDAMMQDEANDEDAFNLENNFIEAEHSDNPIEAYTQIIEIERDNSSNFTWSYKSYEKLCLIYIKQTNFEEFKNKINKLFELYSKVDDAERQDTIRNISYAINEINDDKFKINAFAIMLEIVKDKGIDRAILETGRDYARILFKLKDYEKLENLIGELRKYLDEIKDSDEIIKGMKLEFIVMEIDLKRIKNDKFSIKTLYLEAKELLKVQTFEDKRLSGIINEEGGKIDLRQKEYDKALEKFTLSFHNYKDCGDANAINAFKYSILASLMARNKTIIISTEESKKYENDENLMNVVKLFKAFENLDIEQINQIWNSEINKKEKDNFIKENLNEIIYNIRLNYLINKLKAYKICKIDTLSKELKLNKNDIINMILQIGRNKYLNVKINFVEDYVEIEKNNYNDNNEEKIYKDVVENYLSWINLFK